MNQIWREIPNIGQRYMETRFYPYREANGTISGVVVSTMGMTEAKQAEQAIVRYKHIFDTTTDLVSFIDWNYCYRVINNQYFEIFNKRWDEIIGQPFSVLIDEKHKKPIIKSDLDRAMAGKTHNVRTWREIAGKGNRYFYTKYNPYHDESGEITGVVMSTPGCN